MLVYVNVSTIIRVLLVVDQMYRSCFISLVGVRYPCKHILLEIVDFNVIIGMD